MLELCNMKGIRDIITAKHHHACNTSCAAEPPVKSPVTEDAEIGQGFTDLYEDMGWELPPTSPTDTNLEHYYHYPGVTLGIHRIHGYQIKYERVLVKHDHVATARFVKIHTINVPKRLTCHDAIYLPVGEETVIVTCPEMDCNGRFVFVTVLFYREASSPADCRCGCTPSSSSSIVTVCRNSACSSVGKSVTTGRRVHFAPLASARYPASCPKEVKEASI